MKKRITAILLLLTLCMSMSGPVFADDSLADPLIGKTIYGKTEQFTTTGKNLFNAVAPNKIAASIGSLPASIFQGIAGRSVYIEIAPNTTYTVKKDTVSVMRVATCVDKPALNGTITTCAGLAAAGNEAVTITSGANDRYLLVNLFVNADADAVKSYDVHLPSLMIEVGGAASAYEPYTGGKPAPNTDYPQPIIGVGEKDSASYYTNYTHSDQTYRIDLKQPLFAGDTAELNKLVDGEMHYVESHKKKMIVLDGTEDWILNTDYGVNRFLLRDTNYPTPAAEPNALCTHYTSTNWALTDKTFFMPPSYGLYFRDDSFATLAAWKNFLSYQHMKGTPVTIVYELVEPEVYTYPAVDTGAAGAPDPSDLDGSEVIIQDAAGLLDSVFDYLPSLNTGVLGFMAATTQLLPDWFVTSITISLILSIFIIFLRFLWQ